MNGIFTFGLMIGVSAGDTTLGVLTANLGYDKVVHHKPVFIGDTLRVRPRWRDLRTAGRGPKQGSGRHFWQQNEGRPLRFDLTLSVSTTSIADRCRLFVFAMEACLQSATSGKTLHVLAGLD